VIESLQAVPSLSGGRHVNQRKKNAGDDLKEENCERGTTEDVKPARCITGNRMFGRFSNGRAKLEQRLARWLLMALDRMTTDTVPLTHEFLAVMLGVRRAGITVAIHGFERRGLVTTRRGQLTVVDRRGIEQVAGSFYGTPEAELERLLEVN